MRLPKADSHRISVAFFITLFSALVLCLCIFVVGGGSAVAEQKPYDELIPDYCSFSTPARIAACEGKIALFDGGEIVLIEDTKVTRFPTGVEDCDKLCLSDSAVCLLRGMGEDEDAHPEILAFSLAGDPIDLSVPTEQLNDVACSGDSLYVLSSFLSVKEYSLSDGSEKGSFALTRGSLYFAVAEDGFYFRTVYGSVFKKTKEGYSSNQSVGADVSVFAVSNGKLLYVKDGKVCALGADAPLLSSGGSGDVGFKEITDLAAAEGRLYVLDAPNQAIKVYDCNGESCTFKKMIGSYGSDLKRLKDPVAISVAEGKIAVADAQRGSVFTGGGARALNGRAVNKPTDLVIAGGSIYLADDGVLFKYDEEYIKTTEYRIGNGCTTVAAAPDGTIYAASGKEVYRKRATESDFVRFLTLEKPVREINVGIGGKILYVRLEDRLLPYSQDGVRLGSLQTSAVTGFAVDYRGNVFLLSGNELLRCARTLEGYSEPVRYTLPSGYDRYADLCLDTDGTLYLIADHNVLIYPKSVFDVYVAEDSNFVDTVPDVSPRFVCEVVRDSAISYVAPDNFEDITPIPIGTKLMCYAVVGHGADEYVRVETEKGTVYIPKSDVKIFEEGAAPISKARCLLPAIGSKVVGVNLYDEPSKLAIAAGREPLFKALGKEDIFDVLATVAVDESGKDAWGFYRVSYQDKIAYVLIDEVVSVDDDPPPTPTRYPAKVKSEGLGKTVPVYKEASLDSEIVARLTDGTEIDMLETLDQNKEFISVLYEGEVYYVLSSNLALGGLSGGQVLAIVLAVVAVVGSVLTILILRASKKRNITQKE